MDSSGSDSSASRSVSLSTLLAPFNRLIGRDRKTSSNDEKGPDQLPVLTVGRDAQAVREENEDRRRDVNSLPPWIHSLRRGENVDEQEAHNPLLASPPRIKPAEHHYISDNPHRDHPNSYPREKAGKGKIWNHARTKEAVTMMYPAPDHQSRWNTFAKSSMYPRGSLEDGEVVGEDWLEKNMPDLDTPWRPATTEDQTDPRFWLFSPAKRSGSYNNFQRALMRNAFVPLIIRMTVLIFSLAALGLGVKIFRESESLNNSEAYRAGTDASAADDESYICKQQTSTYMAFIVNVIAPVYIFIVTIDEYRSAPLGLRSSRSKMRLIFLDLVFIIFSAANLSLAFNTLTDEQWSCFSGSPGDVNLNNQEAARSTCVQSELLCHRQRGLVSVLLLAEISWVLAFALSVLRVVERVQR